MEMGFFAILLGHLRKMEKHPTGGSFPGHSVLNKQALPRKNKPLPLILQEFYTDRITNFTLPCYNQYTEIE